MSWKFFSFDLVSVAHTQQPSPRAMGSSRLWGASGDPSIFLVGPHSHFIQDFPGAMFTPEIHTLATVVSGHKE